MVEIQLTYPRLQSALRQAVYLAIKELATTAEDVIMVTSSIMKDMQNNSEVIYKPNAIRALCKIIDVTVVTHMCTRNTRQNRTHVFKPSMAQGVEHFFKAAKVSIYCLGRPRLGIPLVPPG